MALLVWSITNTVFRLSPLWGPVVNNSTHTSYTSHYNFLVNYYLEEAVLIQLQRKREMEELKRRNAQLEEQLRDFKEREAVLRTELERTRMRLHFVEEAEERLCCQMGELEAEAVAQARMYHLHVKELSDQLTAALGLLRSANSVVS
ncbi:hypothetical protein LUZ61_019459 [Rhynchospora tenuis]|uniref:Uncharacterized protein n=1 Tax=Rhynchospora tenuis TaxID=198213 RepID=A0AAD5ZB58_9POAL|nr:hypothetical protein LUZ61_019459 [Rhynchospora tenuis]